MNFLSNPWIIGICCGFITTAIIQLNKNKIVPYIIGYIQRVPKISGDWEVFDSYDYKESDPVGTAKISQFGSNIRISINRKKRFDGSPTNRHYTNIGKLYSGKVITIFEDTGAKGYAIGAMVLQLSAYASVLKGKTLYFDHKENNIITHKCSLKKV